MSYVVAVDSGGTFTDCVILDEQGPVTRAKAPSTPPRYEEGVLAAITAGASRLERTLAELLAHTTMFLHGTTVATNILITRTGAKTALLTTRGHEDAILIGRTVQKVAGLSEAEIIDVAHLAKADPLVARSRIYGIEERIDRDGEVVAPLTLERLEPLRERLHAEGIEAVAVSLLWSFLNPDHEQEVERWLGTDRNGERGWFVTRSSDLAPVLREYERTSTTVLNAYLTPSVNGYLERMRGGLRAAGLEGAIGVMHSAGGVSSIEEARRRGVTLLSSGPAGGMLGARALAERLELDRVIATDVGGTSFDVGLIVDEELSYAEAPVFAQYPVALPVIDVASIGAGGGSIAWIEPETGVLKVGPGSAGARPGPACYGAGGTEPTVTDANLVLGRLNADFFLGGRIRLHPDLAQEAIATLSGRLALSPEATAAAVVEIADSQMADLIRRATVERGLDPAGFTVFCYGGAGGLHACSYAAKLACAQVVVPRTAAVFSAFGIGVSDAKRVVVASDPMREPFSLERWRIRLDELEQRLRAELDDERLPADRLVLRRFVDLQLAGQVHTVRVEVTEQHLDAEDGGETVIRRFVELYEAKYGPGTAYRQAGVEVVTFTVEATASLPTPRAAWLDAERSDAEHARKGVRDVYLSGSASFEQVAVYDAERLRPGNELAGPAVIEADDTTILVHHGQRLWVDGLLDLRIALT